MYIGGDGRGLTRLAAVAVEERVLAFGQNIITYCRACAIIILYSSSGPKP